MIERGLESPTAGRYDQGMATALRRAMTYADLVKLPPDHHRHEILEGEEYMTPSPVTKHQAIVLRLARILADHADRRGLGTVMVAPVDIVFSRTCVLVPDLLFVAAGRLDRIGERFVKGPPDLAIEVTSPSTAPVDRGRKLEIYRKRGVREYWIVDAQVEVVELHEFDLPRRTRIFKEGQAFVSARFPGLKLKVDAVFGK